MLDTASSRCSAESPAADAAEARLGEADVWYDSGRPVGEIGKQLGLSFSRCHTAAEARHLEISNEAVPKQRFS